ncbi:protein of unknown function (DU1801) [Sphingomonas guangdongensis]|uniref:YdhG-like domain-containing protein n=1 Tax=Sphingomonas guangdongensis TaxID=1141890 RepID=A0A285QD40_9SPHN|nr:DUF1801 domain-containing protein [Sphingomonas guangdongensis]SOB79746.1 protein of unknown function (DU1801) [Sphingomonas guangdongensis]
MTGNKTQFTDASVDAFIDGLPDERRREEARTLRDLMERATGGRAEMYGTSIIGFGRYRYRYASGHEGSSCRVGFSPRKAELVLYIGAGRPEQADALAKLGKYRLGKSCLYLKRLSPEQLGPIEAMTRFCYAAPIADEVTT